MRVRSGSKAPARVSIHMKIRSPWVIRIVAFVASLVIRLWIGTTRVRMVSVDGQKHPADPLKTRHIYGVWHEACLAPISTRGPAVQILVSQHADGELIAQVAQWLGIGAVRGSSTRGGAEALLQMMRFGEKPAHLLITPDGPRGPRRKLKPGIVMVAGQTGMSVVPVGVGFSSAWRAGSWDRFAVPRPFSVLFGVFGEPVFIPSGLDRAGIDQFALQIEAEMVRLTELAEDWGERWRRGDRNPPSALQFAGETLRKSA